MSQVSLWQQEEIDAQYAELCNALYERELGVLAHLDISSMNSMQGRLKSLPYYIKRTAHLMLQTQTPLTLDIQNAAWVAKQSKFMPLTNETPDDVWSWYENTTWLPGLVVPIRLTDRIVLDSIDRIDTEKSRFRTNGYGWFEKGSVVNKQKKIQLLKPNKRIMSAACAGHNWSKQCIVRPIIPTLRELLLSCAINWKNFKRPVVF